MKSGAAEAPNHVSRSRAGIDDLNDAVRRYWEHQTCGTDPAITRGLPPLSAEWFKRIESHRYQAEPHLRSFVQFSRHAGARILEIGVGAGTDHLEWARAGAQCHGVDLTDSAIATTRAHLKLHGFCSDLRRWDAEDDLPFPADAFDIVYSWGVIHHSKDPKRIVQNVFRVLKPGGLFIGMMYGRRSAVAFKLWVRRALLKGRPWRTLSDVVWNHMESVGTKAYTVRELRMLFDRFHPVEVTPAVTIYDTKWLPKWSHRFIPPRVGWNLLIRAHKQRNENSP